LYLTKQGQYSYASGISEKNDYKFVDTSAVVKQPRKDTGGIAGGDFASTTKYDDSFLNRAYNKPSTKRRGGGGGGDSQAEGEVKADNVATTAVPTAVTPPSAAPKLKRKRAPAVERVSNSSSPSSSSGDLTGTHGIFQHRLLSGLLSKSPAPEPEPEPDLPSQPTVVEAESHAYVAEETDAGRHTSLQPQVSASLATSVCNYRKSSPVVAGSSSSSAEGSFNYGGILASNTPAWSRPSNCAESLGGGPPLPVFSLTGDDLAPLTSLVSQAVTLNANSTLEEIEEFLSVLRQCHVANAQKRRALEEYKRQAALHYQQQAATITLDQTALDETIDRVEALVKVQQTATGRGNGLEEQVEEGASADHDGGVESSDGGQTEVQNSLGCSHALDAVYV